VIVCDGIRRQHPRPLRFAEGLAMEIIKKKVFAEDLYKSLFSHRKFG